MQKFALIKDKIDKSLIWDDPRIPIPAASF